MDFIKRNYSLVSLIGAFAVGIIAFAMSFRVSREDLIQQTTHTIDVVTEVKWRLVDRKLFTLEQQMNLLSRKEDIVALLPTAVEKSTAQPTEQVDEYVKSILDNMGYTHIWLLDQSGKARYNSNPEVAAVPTELSGFVQQAVDAQKPTLISIVLGLKEPFPFYFCKRITNAKGDVLGTLAMEVPREFLSIELRNTISLDSLNSYLVSSQGTLDHKGRIVSDTCTACKWSAAKFIQSSPREKIGGTWSMLSVYPIDQIDVQHVIYSSMLDGLIAFFMATGIVMVLIFTVQAIQESKGITHADIMLVQTTWNAVSEYSIKIIGGFYKYLFADAPEVRPMFKSAQDEQEKRMALMINTIVNSADSLEEFKGSIAQLAKKHVHMGVKREYFPIVVKAIISSVEEQYGSGFTPAHKKAWYKILNRVSSIMIEEMESYQRTLKSPAAHS